MTTKYIFANKPEFNSRFWVSAKTFVKTKKGEKMKKNLKIWARASCVISGLAIIGDNVIIHPHCVIYDDVEIGDGCKIQAKVFIPNGITIGNNCFIGPGVIFTNDKNPPSNHAGWSKIIIGDNVSIGAGSIILPGVIISKNAMIGAGSVVTKNIPTGEVWMGNPAKFYKMRAK